MFGKSKRKKPDVPMKLASETDIGESLIIGNVETVVVGKLRDDHGNVWGVTTQGPYGINVVVFRNLIFGDMFPKEKRDE